MKRIYILLILFGIPFFLIAVVNANFPFSKSNHNSRDDVRSWRLLGHTGLNIYSDSPTEVDQFFYPSISSIYPDSVITFPLGNPFTPLHRTLFLYDEAHELVQEVLGYEVNINGESVLLKKCDFSYNPDGHLATVIGINYNFEHPEQNISKRWYFNYTNSVLTSYYYSEGTEPYSRGYYRYFLGYDNYGQFHHEECESCSDSISWYPSYSVDIAYHHNEMTSSSLFSDIVAHKQALYMFFPTSELYSNIAEMLDTELASVTKNWSDEQIILQIEYNYDDQDCITDFCRKSYWGGNWHVDENSYYIYNNDSTLNEIYHNVWDAPTGPNTHYQWAEYYVWEPYATGNDDDTAPVTQEFALSVFPNPFSDKMDIKLESKQKQLIKIAIYNLKGQQVYSTSVDPNTRICWNDRKIASGIYFVKAVQGNQVQTKKIVKIK